MRLSTALRLEPSQAVAFTGAGGKSAALRRLLQELAPATPVLVTTTTRLGRGQDRLAAHHVLLSDERPLPDLCAALQSHGSLLVTGELLEAEGKWTAPPAALQPALREAVVEAGAIMLIEADGARGRSLKAPAEHEPAVPDFVDLVVPIAALDALGQPIDSPFIHRPERLAELLEQPLQQLLVPEHLARALGDPRGGLKGVPSAAAVRVLLNKGELDERLAAGREIARRLLAERTAPILSVILASLEGDPPVREVHARVAGVVLAGGESSRLGMPKQLIPWRGQALVWHAVQAARQAGLSPIVVVTGAHADRVGMALEGEEVTIVQNPVWQAGQSTSVRLGLAEVETRAEAAVFLLSDMPRVTGELIRQLIRTHQTSLAPLVAPRAGGRRANPVLFDRSTYPLLRELQGDQGGRALFERFEPAWVHWDDSILLDLDTPEDLRRLQELE